MRWVFFRNRQICIYAEIVVKFEKCEGGEEDGFIWLFNFLSTFDASGVVPCNDLSPISKGLHVYRKP